MLELSSLQKARLQYQPPIPRALQNLVQVDFEDAKKNVVDENIAELFPNLSKVNDLRIVQKQTFAFNLETKTGHQCRTQVIAPDTVTELRATYSGSRPSSSVTVDGSMTCGSAPCPIVVSRFKPQRVGVVLSGGQAAGGHNVITGLYDALKELNQESRLFGFLNGPAGIVKNKYQELTTENIAPYRNQGGFDLIGSGREKIETPEQFESALQTVQALDLDGLIVVGGDDSNTNAAHLAEFFLQKGCKTAVIGVPKTIDGDLQNDTIEISFGFDTACKIYSETIGNIARDALSAKKYYYFVKLMGRSASHITLECALQTHPNLALIGEEIHEKKQTLSQVVTEIVDLIVERAKAKKDYGVIILPEGTIEFLIDVRVLLCELNHLVAKDGQHIKKLEAIDADFEKIAYITPLLGQQARACFEIIPLSIKLQLIQDRDPHGNVQVSKIETERLLISLVEDELKKRKAKSEYTGKFSPQPIFCGYEGRAALPSNFDANYCYNLGRLAAILVAQKKTGYMAALSQLAQSPTEWQAKGASLVSMIHFEEREGKKKTVIKKALVDLQGKVFNLFCHKRAGFRLDDCYCQPGPIQFFGPDELVNVPPLSLRLQG